jgi:hypothetical protein
LFLANYKLLTVSNQHTEFKLQVSEFCMDHWLKDGALKKKASTSNTPVVTETSKEDTDAVQAKYEELQSSVILGTASSETLSDSSKTQ